MSVMDYPVNKNPAQLLRFLGLSGPDAPDRILPVIHGSVDLLPWWFNSLETHANFQVAPVAGSQGYIPFTGAVVPAGQRWVVTAFSISTSVMAAGHSFRLKCAYLRQTPNLTFALGDDVSIPATESGSVDGFAGGTRPWLLLNPGDTLGMFLGQNVGAAPGSLNLNLRFLSFPV